MCWEDIVAVGMGELGITDIEELFSLSWVEWEYRIEHYRITNARNFWEPTRQLYALVASIGSSNPKPAHELIPLYTDTDLTNTKSYEKQESNKELWQRLVGSQQPLPSPLSEK